MAHTVAYVCQGCGSMSSEASEFHERGFVTKKRYCARCVKVVDEYLEARDELHTDLATKWSEDLAFLRADIVGNSRVKNLPDG